MKGKTALIVGPVCKGKNEKNGQTCKLNEIDILLKAFYGKVDCFSTHRIKKHPFRIFKLLREIKKYDDIWFVLSRNGTRFLGPMMMWFNPSKNYFYTNVGIGTLLLEYQASYPRIENYSLSSYLKTPSLWEKSRSKRLKKFYSKCKKVFVESDLMKRNFEFIYDLKNVSYLPNFRTLGIPPSFSKGQAKQDTKKFIYLSRIIPSKGVGDLVETANALLEEGLAFSLDIYGPVRQGDRDWFENIKKIADANISFKGELQDKIIEKISEYDYFVFPTKSSEGMPGVIVESFFAGVPVITSDFSYAKELVSDGEEGFIYRFDDKQDLKCKMESALSISPLKWNEMHSNCLKRASCYSFETAKKILQREFSKND